MNRIELNLNLNWIGLKSSAGKGCAPGLFPIVSLGTRDLAVNRARVNLGRQRFKHFSKERYDDGYRAVSHSLSTPGCVVEQSRALHAAAAIGETPVVGR